MIMRTNSERLPIPTYGRYIPRGLFALLLAPWLWMTRDENPIGWFITWVFMPLLVVVVALDLFIVAVWAIQRRQERR